MDGTRAHGPGRNGDVESSPARAPAGSPTGTITPDEKPPLEPHASRPWLSRLSDDISLTWADWPILACSFVTGLVDCIAFNAGSVFVSMQTGNTVFLALGAASLPVGQPHIWLPALVSLVAFWLGCYFFANFRHFQPKRKATLSICFLIQAILIFVAAALAQTGVAPAFAYSRLDPNFGADASGQKEANEGHYATQIVIALLSFQSSGQIVLSRTLGFNEIPTNVVTSLYCDLLSDHQLFAPLASNVKRNRRVVAVILLLGGGISGSWLQRSKAGMPGGLWIAGATKLAIAVAWLGWRAKEKDNMAKSSVT